MKLLGVMSVKHSRCEIFHQIKNDVITVFRTWEKNSGENRIDMFCSVSLDFHEVNTS